MKVIDYTPSGEPIYAIDHTPGYPVCPKCHDICISDDIPGQKMCAWCDILLADDPQTEA